MRSPFANSERTNVLLPLVHTTKRAPAEAETLIHPFTGAWTPRSAYPS